MTSSVESSVPGGPSDLSCVTILFSVDSLLSVDDELNSTLMDAAAGKKTTEFVVHCVISSFTQRSHGARIVKLRLLENNLLLVPAITWEWTKVKAAVKINCFPSICKNESITDLLVQLQWPGLTESHMMLLRRHGYLIVIVFQLLEHISDHSSQTVTDRPYMSMGS